MPRRHRLHPHSLTTYREEQPTLGARASTILDLFRRVGQMSDREVLSHLGLTDPNAVRPRITELVRMGLLREVGTTTDFVTHKTVRVCEAVREAPAQMRLFA